MIKALDDLFQTHLSEYKITLLAKNCENIFHGKSSGIDVQTILRKGIVSFDNDKVKNYRQGFNKICIIDTGKPQFSTKEVVSFVAKKNENDIQNLCNQLENLKLKSRTQNDELTKKNLEMNNNQKCLNEVKNDNANLNNQINLKISSLDTIQKQLTIANQSIVDMQNELNNLEKSHSLGLNQLENIKINFKNEHEKRVQAENDNVRLEGILKDKEDNMNKLSSINGQLKADRDKLVVTKNKLLDDLDKYKNHIMILTEQTEKLTDELQRIIDEDSELYNLNNAQIQRLQKVIYENKKMLSDEIAALNALENYVRNQTNYGTTLNQSVEQNRKTYSINNNQ